MKKTIFLREKLFSTTILAVGIMLILSYTVPANAIPPTKYPLSSTEEGVTGDCSFHIPKAGFLQWKIRINGLEPGATGHFDLGDTFGHSDVPFVADTEGKANSGIEFIVPAPAPGTVVTCYVYLSPPGDHSVLIASAVDVTTP